MRLYKGKLNVLIDGQFGSTGKGLFSSFVAKNNTIDIAVSNSSTNAGHTFYFKGRKMVAKQLPVTGICSKAIIYLCAGAIINPEVLLEEIATFNIDVNKLFIHPNATIILPEDIETEQKGAAVHISSTQNGVGAALSRKISREALVAKDIPKLQGYIKNFDLQEYISKGSTAFMEVPQGLDLSLNSIMYPYCTSREINVQSALTDSGVHPHYLGKVIACIRTFPIRVGNLEGGYSGPFYDDSKETTWDAIGVPKEYTTNTKRLRRVATFSFKQYHNMLKKLRPDYIFLNFCNYMKSRSELDALLDKLPEVTHLGFSCKTQGIITREFYDIAKEGQTMEEHDG